MASDSQVRVQAFKWLSDQVNIFGDVLPRSILAEGFSLDGQRIPLIGPQGIFKPAVLPQYPISITTSPESPYDDSFQEEGLLQYRYRGTDPGHPDNERLRSAGRNQIPLIYFHGVVRGKYLAIWPVFVVGDEPEKLSFLVAADDPAILHAGATDSQIMETAENPAPRRAYITASIRVRLHQRGFRERVLDAYQEQCAFCRLRHVELLDAAHIIPDKEAEGNPEIKNGISLCKLHHAAFDSNIIGLKPDYLIQVRQDILREEDGPMLIHGLKNLHDQSIVLPRQMIHRPDRDLLQKRYEKFRMAS